jgi:hypothetical protein
VTATTTASLGAPSRATLRVAFRFRWASALFPRFPRDRGLPEASLASAVVQPASGPAMADRCVRGWVQPAAHLLQPLFVISVQPPLVVVDEDARSDVHRIHQDQCLPCGIPPNDKVQRRRLVRRRWTQLLADRLFAALFLSRHPFAFGNLARTIEQRSLRAVDTARHEEWSGRRRDPVCPLLAFQRLVLNANRQRAIASLHFNSKVLEDVLATIRRGRSGQGSLPCSTPLQSRAGTSPGSPHIRRLPPRPGVGSSNRR